ncbi:MAG TPA: hypothetical protein VG168_05930 [Bryobacteraceae bacterium]|nr:hypothetical protein [Bryobacteraceae bacterium]
MKHAVDSAFRRSLTVLAIEQLALAITIMFGGGVLLLLLGTQILNWYWLALLGIAALVLGGTRVILRRPTKYQVAQRLDGRLRLHDSIATAWHLLTSGAGHEDPPARFQIEYAGKLAGAVNAASAFPFTGQRTWGLAGALAGLAFGLFAVRYLVQNSLNLEHPLITVHLEPVFESLERRLSAANRNPNAPGFASAEQADARKDATGQDEGKTQKNLDGSQDPNGDRPADATNANSAAANKQGQADGKKQDGKADGAAGTQQENKPGAGETASNQSNNRTTDSPTNPNRREIAGNQQNQQPGLLDKMKDAMSTLLSKMRPNGNSQNSQQNSQKKNSQDQQTSQMAQAERDQHSQSQDSRDQQNSQDPSSQGEEQGQTAEKAQAAQGHGSDRPSDKNGSDAHSGIGRQDGAKGLKEAQQEEAMGKLAEIFGKRSAVVSGDVMVETPSGKQQLKTDYSQRIADHSDSGGQINRDEVPLIYQQYVREYMEQVRKQAKSENVNQ